MKTKIIGSLFILAGLFAVHAQSGDYTVIERGADYKIVENVTVEGATNRYTELATGMNYTNASGQWVESSDQITIQPGGGAAAVQGRHKVYFPGNIYNGVIEVVTPDGRHLKSRPVGVSYDDGSNTVFIATLKSANGYLTSSNTVTYRDAFTGFKADLVCTYRRGGFESDLVFRQQPPTPDQYGLNNDSSTLQLVTEFFNTQDPQEIPSVEDRDYGLRDVNLKFGSLLMIQGKAFATKISDTNAVNLTPEEVPVYKTWVNFEGRKFLIEEVPLLNIADNFDALPLTASIAPAKSRGLLMASNRRQFPPSRGLVTDTNQIQLAALDFSKEPGVVLDYQSIITSQTNFTFKGDTTYYISGALNLFGTNTFEGGAVLKYATNSSVQIATGTINWQGSVYRPVILTARDDNTVGDTISGSTGNPVGYYATSALFFSYSASAPTISYCRVSWANTGIYVSATTANISHGQFLNCNLGVSRGYGPLYLQNVLFKNVVAAVGGSSGNLDAQHTTFYGSSCVVTNPNYTTLTFTNCILANVVATVGVSGSATYTLAGNNNGFYQASPFGGNSMTNLFFPFKTDGAGLAYLTNGCAFRDAGTTNINSSLLADLRQKTTYPPITYANVTLSATTFSPQAKRDTDTPDLGYHYDPLDYVFGGCGTSGNLTFTKGVAAGWFSGTSGNGLLLSSDITFNGTATAPCWWVRRNLVQESDNTSGGNGISGYYNSNDYYSVYQVNAQYLFSAKSPFNDNYGLAVNAQNCEFYAESIGYYNITMQFYNCLLWRCQVTEQGGSQQSGTILRNCTMWGGSLTLYYPYYYFTVNNCAFDDVSFGVYLNDTNYFQWDYNAYAPTSLTYNYGATSFAGPHDRSGVTFNWQTSWLGKYYLTTNSTLINAGNSAANLLGLYHFTTQTNQVKEANSTVDIGYHYVAVDGNGDPISTLVGGVPDYIADPNGDGLPDWWEWKYFGYYGVDPNGDPDTDGMSNLQEYLAGSNPLSATMVLAWGDNTFGECNVPAGLTNAVAVAGNGNGAPTITSAFSLALKADGGVVAWGDNSLGQTNVPSGLNGVKAIAAGNCHGLALRTNGTVAIWGSWLIYGPDTFTPVSAPAGLSNVVAIAAIFDHDLALKSDGSVVAWGYDTNQLWVQVPTNLPPAKAVAGGWYYSAALLTNGTVAVWGAGWDVATNLNNIIAIAGAPFDFLALKADGTVVDVVQGQIVNFPGVSNIVAIANGYYPGMALRNDGTNFMLGTGLGLPSYPLSNLQAIGAGWKHALAIRGGLLTPFITGQPTDQTVLQGTNASFSVVALSFAKTTYQWQFNNVDISQATNATLNLTNMIAGAQGNYRCVVANPAGSLASSNAVLTIVQPPVITFFSAPTNRTVMDGTMLNLSVKAVVPGNPSGYPISYQWQFNGKDNNGATATNYTFSTLFTGDYSVRATDAVGSTNVVWHIVSTNAPVNVTNDLLLIYNTNSADSITCVNYYLAHRPNVGGANVLGIGYTNPVSPTYFETVTPSELTNQILNPVSAWLTNNPTKRPQYVILFMDLPSRCNTSNSIPAPDYPDGIIYPSVSVQLNEYFRDWQPYVTHLNMGMTNTVNRTNDCIAYINKLASLGVPLSSNNPILSASLGGYANTNYVLDGVRNAITDNRFENFSDAVGTVSNTIPTLLSAGVSPNAIYFYDSLIVSNYQIMLNVFLATHLSNGVMVNVTNYSTFRHATNGANLAGYVSWGVHANIASYQTYDGTYKWSGNSGWYLINTIESHNGKLIPLQGSVTLWYSSTAFGGTNYSNTPVGAVTTVDEPGLGGKNDNSIYFGLWASGKNFGVCAWVSKASPSPYFQAVGDPLIKQ